MTHVSLMLLLVACSIGFTGCADLSNLGSWCGCSSSKTESVATNSKNVATDDAAEDSSDDSDSTDS